VTGRLYFNRHAKRWQAIVELGHDGTGRRRQIFRNARTKAEARLILRTLLREVEDGTHVEPTELSVGEFLRAWHSDHARHHLSARAHESNGFMLERHVIPALGAHKLNKLRATHLEAYYSGKLDSGLSPASVRKHHCILHTALRHAVRLQLIGLSPADLAMPPRVGRSEMKALDEGQAAAMLRAAAGTALYLPLLLAIGTGMRRGELLGLRWADVDLEAGTATVNRTLQEAYGELHLKEPKTTRSRRAVTLPSVVVEVLRAHRAQQARRTLAHEPGWTDPEYVLAAPHGGPWRPSNFDRIWRRFKTKQKLEIRFPLCQAPVRRF
jgi:integrase